MSPGLARDVAWALLAAWLLASGCGPWSVPLGGTGADAGDEGIAPVPAPGASELRSSVACPTGGVVCDGTCVDLQTSSEHCGACGCRCDTGCEQGRCVVACPLGAIACPAPPDDTCRKPICVDPTVDRGHCGACGNACEAGHSCVAGRCRADCPAGQAACGDRCLDLRFDRANCGACGHDCGAAAPCVMGACGLLVRDLGGPLGFGSRWLRPGSAVVTDAVPLASTFQEGLEFYGARYFYLFVHSVGVLSFAATVPATTPRPFPTDLGPLIAPWWADVDLRANGRPGRNGVYHALRPGRAVFTWYNVGYFDRHDDLLNTFQVLLHDRSDVGRGDFDIELRYAKCEWTTGDASGGLRGLGGRAAQAGIDAGNGTDALALPGSGTAAVLDLCRATNVPGAPEGFWLYPVRHGRVAAP